MTRSREELAHDVVMLTGQGMSVRAIARALHVGRNRVRKILDGYDAARNGDTPPSALPPPPASRPSMLDAHEAFVRGLIARFPTITAQRVYEELQARQDPAFDGSYTIVKKYVRALRPKPVVQISTPVEEPEPGKVAECDWATITIDFKNRTRQKLQVFGYTLAYSHRRYYRLYDRADFHALLDGHVEASTTSRASPRSASATGRRRSCCAGKVNSPSIIHASSHLRRTIYFGHGRVVRIIPMTSRTSS